ncbi:MAG: rane protein, partial [Sediminibacterium sp.]|nr:rane protein [Sediminibacterium sp.]
MQFKKINNISGWVVCLVACTVYIMTAEAGGSFWDCGEFVSSCFKLQIPHPPGAPLFVILGRLFIVLFGDNPLTAAKAVNIMNALASGFTILFLFWTITHFARRIVNVKTTDVVTRSQVWSIIGAGAVGALAYTFSDSFWYSAVEGEVYAMSSFFTAIVFWAILKWENHADEPGADRWIVFIFFMMGLSIGVHLLNLLTIPAIVMVYYFRRRDGFNYPVIRKWFLRILAIGGAAGFIGALVLASGEATDNVPMDSTLSGLILFGTLIAIGLFFLAERWKKDKKAYYGGTYIFFVIGCAITGIMQVGLIQYTVKLAGTFDRWFVNGFSLPFFSGFSFFFILVAALIWYGLKFATRKGWPYL